MIVYEERLDSICVFHRNQRLIQIGKMYSTIAIGKGTAEYFMKRGSFRFKQRITEYKPLYGGRVEVGFNTITILLTDNTGKNIGKLLFTAESKHMIMHLELLDKTTYNRYWITLPSNKNEKIYGCGEHFTRFNLKGERVRIWVAEHQNSNRIANKIILEKIRGKRPDRMIPFSKYETYYAQPTFISSSKYFFHAESTAYMEFDFTKEDNNILMIHDIPDLYFGAGESFKEISTNLSELLGRQPELPKWVYEGAILGIQGGTEVVEEKIKNCMDAGMKITGVWCQDWEGARITSFGKQLMWNWKWDEELYRGLDKKLAEWKERGIHFLGYINPFLAVEKELYAYASEKGYCVHTKSGEDYMVTITTFPAAMVDLTNPEAYEWIKGIIKKNLIDFGLNGWMADFGEYLPTDCVLSSGEDPKIVHNRWPALWARANREAVEESDKLGKVFFFTRAGFTETIKYSTMMWNGDQHVDWSMDDGLPSVIPGTLSLAMSGFGVTHSDVGGYTTIMHMRREEELLMRWAEMNVFSPVFRSHEGNQPDNNVHFDSSEALLVHYARMSRLYAYLAPYLKKLVKENSDLGIPVMRPLFYHHEEEQAYDEAYEYLLGEALLVAPVIKKGARTRRVYLPQGTWYHVWTKEEYRGGNYEVKSELGFIPVFIKKDSIDTEYLMGLSEIK